jgi:hypothetical protein
MSMPRYHNRKHPDLGKIRITPRPWWRNWFRFLPYFVGDTIRFRVQIETPQETPNVYERFGNEALKSLSDFPGPIDSGDEEIIGNPISGEGDIEYKVGFWDSPDSAVTVMTAKAVNTDRWLLGCVGLVVGAIATFIITVASGIVLGFIKVEPILRMFITP